jgi:hypothetical protein
MTERGQRRRARNSVYGPVNQLFFKVDLYMKLFGLCAISRINTIVNEKII